MCTYRVTKLEWQPSYAVSLTVWPIMTVWLSVDDLERGCILSRFMLTLNASPYTYIAACQRLYSIYSHASGSMSNRSPSCFSQCPPPPGGIWVVMSDWLKNNFKAIFGFKVVRNAILTMFTIVGLLCVYILPKTLSPHILHSFTLPLTTETHIIAYL